MVEKIKIKFFQYIMGKKSLENVEKKQIEQNSSNSIDEKDDGDIQASKVVETQKEESAMPIATSLRKKEETKVDTITKEKKPRTQKQIEATNRMRDRLKEETLKRAEQKKLEEEQRKKQLEEKIVNKALSIKKKQIKKEKVLDAISDDETPMEEVKKMIKPKKQIEEKIETKIDTKPKITVYFV
jgi:hypothetical protein